MSESTRTGPVVVQLSTVHRSTDVRIRVKECRSLVDAGYSVKLIALGPEVAGLASDGVDITVLDVDPTRRLRRMTVGLVKAYRATMKQSPKLVHFHDPELLLLAPLFRLAGLKVVFDVHEDIPGQVRSKHYLPNVVRRPLSTLIQFAEPLLARTAHAVVVVDPKWEKRYSNHTIPLRNYPSAGEFAGFKRETDFNDCDPHFVYVGAVTKIRGATDIVGAANHPAAGSVTCTVGGPIQDGIEGELQQLNSGAAVTLSGWVDRDAVIEMYRTALAGLAILAPVPNYLEATATKVFEYMHAGLPMILSDTPSHRRLIDKYGCGLLVPFGDTEALAQAMNRLATDRTLAFELGKAASDAGEEFSWETDVLALLECYSDLVPISASARS